MAAEFATPEKIAFYVRHTSGRDLRRRSPASAATSSTCPSWSSATPRATAPPSPTRSTSSRAPPRASRPPTGPSPSGPWPTPPSAATTWPDPVTSSRCGPAPGGVLKRAGHTEAAVDLARLAGLTPPGCCARSSTTTARCRGVPDLERFCAEHGLLLISIADLIRHRSRTEQLVHRVGEAAHPDAVGPVPLHRLPLVARRRASTWPSCRATSAAASPCWSGSTRECLTGDVFGSLRCDCGPQLHAAMAHVADGGPGRGGLPARPRGPRHRHRPQDPGLQPAGRGPRHGRRQPPAGPAGRQPGVRHRRPDPGRARRHRDAAHDQQPGQVRRPRGLRPGDRRAGPASRSSRPRRTPATCRPSATASATCSTSIPPSTSSEERAS